MVGISSLFPSIIMNFIVFLLISSHLLLTLADQISHPVAGSKELKPSFLGRRSALATGGIVAILTLALILVFNSRKQAAPTEGSGCPSPEVLRRFSFSEIVSATGRSSRSISFIRRQGSGQVYDGYIDDGKRRVAIIKLSFDLWNEVETLSKLRHGNLVSLIGYCNESSHMFLVYESIGSSLSDTLQTDGSSLSWHQRLKICIGAASGLGYLHTCLDGGITHGDLKSSDIFLDENYKPKIADFGLISDSAQESDVYSFGVVLLDVLCGKTSENSRDQFIGRAKSLIYDGHINQMVDPRLNGQISSNCLKELAAIIRKCLHTDPKRRHTMVQVVARLELLSDNKINVSEVSSAHKKKESSSTSGNKVNVSGESSARDIVLGQNVSWSEFVAATLNFNPFFIWSDVVAYKIYKGKYEFGCKNSEMIIYRGKYMPDDISKLTELSNLSHPNLASMEGFCCKGKETFVGYKNEGLSLLYACQWTYNLPWPTRLKICIGVAEAVRCLHAAKIIHGGICTSTVFVDVRRHRAKLATFGTISSNCTTYQGLPLPPDISGSANMTEKTDVYLFGLLLLTIFCGNKMDFSSGFPFLLHNKFFEAINQRTLCYITDMNLKDTENNLYEFLNVAFDCCRLEQSDRPSMHQVVEYLKAL